MIRESKDRRLASDKNFSPRNRGRARYRGAQQEAHKRRRFISMTFHERFMTSGIYITGGDWTPMAICSDISDPRLRICYRVYSFTYSSREADGGFDFSNFARLVRR